MTTPALREPPSRTKYVAVSTIEMTAFVVVVKLRSFTKAAEVLQLTQQGVTRMVQRIERSIGRKLLDRSSHKITVTPEGVGVHNWCVDTLNGLEVFTGHRIGEIKSAGEKQ